MKKIVIMGATSGIGLVVAKRMIEKGWLVGAAGRNEEALERLRIRNPDNVVTAKIDITEEGSEHKLIDLINRMGGMDVYFHVSGIFYENFDLEIDEEIRTLQTNAVGFARMCATAYRYFRDTDRRGKIGAVTSIAGANGIGRLASYSSSKRFQQTYLRALNQLATIDGADVRFCDIRPGWVDTPLISQDEYYPMTMPLSYAVPKIVESLMRGRRVSVIDWRWNIVVGLWRLIPNWLWVRIPLPISIPR